jgi:hypothetical protein
MEREEKGKKKKPKNNSHSYRKLPQNFWEKTLRKSFLHFFLSEIHASFQQQRQKLHENKDTHKSTPHSRTEEADAPIHFSPFLANL